MNNLTHIDRTLDSILFDSLIIILFILSLFMLFIGVSGIIEYESPSTISTFSSISGSIIADIRYHVLIISGSLVFTFSVWLASNHKQ